VWKKCRINSMEESSKSNQLVAKSLLLTYKDCPKSWTKEFVKRRLVEDILVYKHGKDRLKSRVKAWIVARTEENDTATFICLFELEKRAEIQDTSEFDLRDAKGDYQAVSNLFLAAKDVKEHQDWIGEGFPGMPPIKKQEAE
jgi:hypothetical protein